MRAASCARRGLPCSPPALCCRRRYLFIKLLPRYEDVAPRRRRVVLPRKARGAPKISLVLDLDETLVHCSIEPIPDADLTFSVAFNGQDYQVYVRKRPYLAHFLEEVSKLFEVTVFTASQSVYAETLLDLIDPKRRLVKYVLPAAAPPHVVLSSRLCCVRVCVCVCVCVLCCAPGTACSARRALTWMATT